MSYLQANTEEDTLLRVGDKASDFILKGIDGDEWQLSEQTGQVTALLFYPKNETLVCTKQLCSVRDNWADYIKTKAQIVAISPGTITEHQNFARRHHLPMLLLADADREVTKIFTWHWIIPINFTRAIVIVDAKGIVRHRKVMLRAFRPTDKSVLASIYAARTDVLYENFDKINEDLKNRKTSEAED